MLRRPARVYATGMSNGALPSGPTPHPTSVLEIHGLADQNVRMDGSPGAGVASVDGMPVADVNALWRTADSCQAPEVTTSGPLTTSTATCADGHTVDLITIEGAGHQWPGSKPVRDGGDPPSTALDATATIWAFFDSK